MAVRTVEVTESYRMPDLVSRVERGVKMLDAKVPGWDQKVDLKALNLAEGTVCVVGQLAIKSMLNGPLDGYEEGMNKLFPKLTPKQKMEDIGERHGFEVSMVEAQEVADWLKRQPPTHPWWPFVSGPELDVNFTHASTIHSLLYDYLTAIWIQVIKARQKAAADLKKAQKAAQPARASRRSTR